MNQPFSYIHPQAEVADNVVVEPFVTISKDVVIGEGSWIGPHVTIMEGARIGKNCKIFPGAVVSAEPQDLKYEGEYTTTLIGDNTTLRECVTVNKGTRALGRTEVGSNCLLMAYSHVAHDCIVGNNCVIANGVNLAGHIVVGDWVVLGGVVAVHQFVRIGNHAFITGGSLVRKDVPPFVKAAREPLSYAGVNSVGLQRRGFSDKQIAAIQDLYRILFVQHHNISKAIESLNGQTDFSAEQTEILNFIRSSERGIMKGYHLEHD